MSLLLVFHFKRSVSLNVVQNEMQTFLFFFLPFKEYFNPTKQVSFMDSIIWNKIIL